MNEAVYRSPKWLKKYLDFELHTGEDINGKVSKREIREEARRKKEEAAEFQNKNNKEWERRWNRESETKDFQKFYREWLPGDLEFQYSVYSSDLRKIKDKWLHNFELWNRFDVWIKKENDLKKKEKEQERIKKELDDLYNSLFKDYNHNQYDDKFPNLFWLDCVLHESENYLLPQSDAKYVSFCNQNTPSQT